MLASWLTVRPCASLSLRSSRPSITIPSQVVLNLPLVSSSADFPSDCFQQVYWRRRGVLGGRRVQVWCRNQENMPIHPIWITIGGLQVGKRTNAQVSLHRSG